MKPTQTRRRLRLRDLDTLLGVVQAGGMRKAAGDLHLSQAAISKAVRGLEDTLGVPLLVRGRQGVEPTPFGEAMVRRTRALFDELDGALAELTDMADPGSGEVRFGAMETLQAGLVGAAMARALRQHPRMRFRLESGQAPDLLGHFLRERLVEFVIARPYELPLPPDLEGQPLFRDRLIAGVGPTSPWARRRRITLADLVDEEWLLSRNEAMSDSPIIEAFRDAGLPAPRIRVVTGSLNLRYALLATGRFVTVVPHSMPPFADHRAFIRLLKVPLPTWRTPTMIVTLRGRTPTPAATLFLDLLRRMARPLDED